jgi:putative nucleotidyltransferase with HDIG domain
MEQHFLEVTKSLVMALETKDEYTAGHLERVSRYATRLAEELKLSPEEIEAVREAALLHDIGKIGIPDEVLHKVGQLTEEEKGHIRQHLLLGAKILEPMKFFRPITTLIYHHHERYDGKGYPHGLTGEFIPSGAQVIAIADSFDAMTTARSYNKPKTAQEALEELRRGSGTQFNPKYLEAFKRSDFEAMLAYYKRNYPKEPYAEDTSPVIKVKCPVLVIHGLNDPALLPGALSGTWEWIEKDLTLVTVPGAGHWVQQDAMLF